MCYSFEVNFSAWVISFIMSIYMLGSNKYDTWIPLFILTYSQIQILESLIWINKDPKYNELLTVLISFFLWLQPLINCYLGSNDKSVSESNKKLLRFMMLMYFLIIIYNFYTINNYKFISEIENKHLSWNRYDENNNKINIMGSDLLGFIYLIGLLFPFYLSRDSKYKYVIIFGFITLIISYVKYRSTYTSMWCFGSVFLVFIALIINKKIE